MSKSQQMWFESTSNVDRGRAVEQPLSVLVFGAFGFLGTALSNWLAAQGMHVHKVGRENLGSSESEFGAKKTLGRIVEELKPHTVVNLAALTDVDLCERDPDKAFADIVHPLDFLRQVQGAYPFRIVQISTDQVYSGGGPHSEASSTRPINAYGRMKLLAEGLLDINRDLIVRTNFIGRSQSQKKKSWTDWLVKSLSSGKEVRIDPRAQFSPLHVHDICHYVSLCISENISGLFNLGSSTSVKKIKFAREFASDLAFDDQLIRELEPAAIVARAPRPLDLRLDSRRFESRMNINLPDVSAVKQRTLKDYIGSSGV